MAGHAVLQPEKAAQERLFGLGEQRHVHRALAAAQHRAQRDHQQLMEIVQTGIAGSRILQSLQQAKTVPRRPGGACFLCPSVNPSRRATQAQMLFVKQIPNAIPLSRRRHP